MKTRSLVSHVLATTLAVVSAPGLAAAAEHGGDHASFGWYIANFVVLLVVLGYFGRKPVTNFLVERKEAALVELRAAESARDDARAKLAEYEARLGRIENEVATILSETIQGAEAERDRILRGAEEAAERIRGQASLMLEQEVQRARQQLADEMTEAASREAAALVRQSFGAGDQDRLVQEFLAVRAKQL